MDNYAEQCAPRTVVGPMTVTRHNTGSWADQNESAAYAEGTRHGWPVARVLYADQSKVVLHRYAHTAEEVPPGWTPDGWAFYVAAFYAGLPFRHGMPHARNVVYDLTSDLRVVNLSHARLRTGSPFAPPSEGAPDEGWASSAGRTTDWEFGYMLLSVIGAAPGLLEDYTHPALHCNSRHPVAQEAWRWRDGLVPRHANARGSGRRSLPAEV